jgi:23S rRNA methylase
MRKLHDRYFKQAKREGKLARSVYKLEELNSRDRIIKRGDKVLDLGASPGSWLEYILGVIGGSGSACAVDLKPIDKKFKGRATFRMMDIMEMRGDEFSEVATEFDAIVSDMAPNTSGIRIMDQARSQELCEAVVRIACPMLKTGGNLVMKIFYGPETEFYRAQLAKRFATVKVRKPEACRDESTEHYLVCLGHGLEPKVKKDKAEKSTETKKTPPKAGSKKPGMKRRGTKR